MSPNMSSDPKAIIFKIVLWIRVEFNRVGIERIRVRVEIDWKRIRVQILSNEDTTLKEKPDRTVTFFLSQYLI